MLTWMCGFKLKEIYETGTSENVGTGTAHFGYEERFERVESKDDASRVKCYTMMETNGKIQWVKEGGYEQTGPVPRRCTV